MFCSDMGRLELWCHHFCFACSAILAHIMLNERLNVFGILGCVLCISGSITIALHAPEEREILSLLQVWAMAIQPGRIPYLPLFL